MFMLYRVKEDFATQFHRFRAGMIVAMHEIVGDLTDAHMAKLAPVSEMEIVSDAAPVAHADEVEPASDHDMTMEDKSC